MGKKYLYFLTNKDEKIPLKKTKTTSGDEVEKKTHVPIYELMANPKFYTLYPDFQDNEENIRKMRKDTYDRIKELYDKSNTKYGLAEYWNRHINHINETDINCFYRNKGLRSVAHLIEMFQFTELARNSFKNAEGKYTTVYDNKRNYISFGIDKKYLADYLNKGEIKKGINKKGRPPKADSVVQGKWFARLENVDGVTKNVEGRKTINYELFCKWCTINAVDKTQALDMALELLLKTYPCEEITTSKEKIAEKRKSPMDYLVGTKVDIDPDKEDNESIHRTINVNRELYEICQKICKNYNNDPFNYSKGNLSFTKLVKMALTKFVNENPQISLKYGNPEVYEKLIEIEKAKEYNKKILDK